MTSTTTTTSAVASNSTVPPSTAESESPSSTMTSTTTTTSAVVSNSTVPPSTAESGSPSSTTTSYTSPVTTQSATITDNSTSEDDYGYDYVYSRPIIEDYSEYNVSTPGPTGNVLTQTNNVSVAAITSASVTSSATTSTMEDKSPSSTTTSITSPVTTQSTTIIDNSTTAEPMSENNTSTLGPTENVLTQTNNVSVAATTSASATSSATNSTMEDKSLNSTTTSYTSSMTSQSTALTDVSTPGLTEVDWTPTSVLSGLEPIEKINDLESIVSAETTLTAEDSAIVVEIVGSIAALPSTNLTEDSGPRLLRILDQVADKVNVSDGEVFNATTPTVFVAVVNLPGANSSIEGNFSGVGLKVVNENISSFTDESFALYYEEHNTIQSSIFIPYEVISKSKDGKVSFYSFLGDSFFRPNSSSNIIGTETNSKKSFVNSDIIISATILDPEISTENLRDNIKISFRINESSAIFGSSVCGFWVEDGSYWSSEGCTKLPSSDQLLRCECNHLTNFASLFAYGNLTHDKGLDILTYVGCTISAIASLCTIIALLIIWKSIKVQMKQSTKFVMLNLSLSLFLLNILILISEIPGVRSDEEKCRAVAGTLHFALISTFLWMFAQAVPVFISIIKPIYFKVYFSSKKFIISFLFLGWGLPLILVVLFATLKPEWYVSQVNDVNPDKTPKIQGQFRCWIVPDMMIYLVIIPAAILLSCILFLYVCSTIKYLLQKRPGEKSMKQREGQLKTNLRFSLTLFVMFGITWIFGFLIFNSSDVSLAFAYIFTIFNSLQGFTLFIIFIRRKGVKQNIRESLLKLTPKPSVASNTSRVKEERTSVSVTTTTRQPRIYIVECSEAQYWWEPSH
ncbi:adhesion G-protein coupled receptor G6-like [Clavelina lepadiformis]|uniref:adhesion G-protein coupled receptor G6-like n=1 Tax=Clavelina lepadiformis TaxID=159417 RepID=UPI0040433A14